MRKFLIVLVAYVVFVAVMLIAVLAFVVAGTVRAEAKIHNYAIVVATRIQLVEDGLHILHLPAVEVPYERCDPADPANEAVKATAKLRAAEVAEALALGYETWSPRSRARCERKQWDIRWLPSLESPEEIVCEPPPYVADYDWSLAWTGCAP